MTTGRNPINIVPFTMDAYEGAVALWTKSEGIGLSGADSRDSIASYLERNPGMSFIAKTDTRTIGVVLCGHDGRRGYIHHLAVDAEFRRQDIGRALVARCLSALKENRIQKCHLFIFRDNTEGIQFWENIGWQFRADICMISKTLP